MTTDTCTAPSSIYFFNPSPAVKKPQNPVTRTEGVRDHRNQSRKSCKRRGSALPLRSRDRKSSAPAPSLADNSSPDTVALDRPRKSGCPSCTKDRRTLCTVYTVEEHRSSGICGIIVMFGVRLLLPESSFYEE